MGETAIDQQVMNVAPVRLEGAATTQEPRDEYPDGIEQGYHQNSQTNDDRIGKTVFCGEGFRGSNINKFNGQNAHQQAYH